MLRGDPASADRARLALERLDDERIGARIDSRDPTVWRTDPREISDRLGWLDLPRTMASRTGEMHAFADRLKKDAVGDVLLLGMGGSSLAPEVFRRTFGSAPGRPRLHVLDTTSPAWIRRAVSSVDARSLHALVASKSGSTIEVRTLFAFVLDLVRRAGVARPGSCFTGITDPGTGIESLSRAHEFAHLFTNPPDIGGRYSALSFFGLVPAAAIGVDVDRLLERGASMAARCAGDAPAGEHPGLVLGAILGSAARAGRDKLTLVCSPAIDAFGMWVEQLVAESTGKDDTGIVPVIGEPWAEPRRYGDDRLFVLLALGDDRDIERRAEELAGAGHPVVFISWNDAYDLGGEMFRWEYATAVAGHLLEIHPFDQPNVESAKRNARAILDDLARGEPLPWIPEEDPIPLLSSVVAGETAAFMVFGEPTLELESAFETLRRALVDVRGVATTLGFGPRFLHSTGQLHKGGPANAVFVQILIDEEPLPIPGERFGFEALLAAQAAGDWLALRQAKRRVVRAPRTQDVPGAIRVWAERVRKSGR
jgi:glucose-6-phosphate isomerase/transaldolase/glucose-6-phosphate isomerase